MEKLNLKNSLLTILLIIIALISILGIAPLAKSNKFHNNTIHSLDKKKITVTELTVACAGSSMALAAIPGDATTPVANKIMDLSSYLLVIIGVIFLEKILLTLTGYVTFTFLIPISCVLLGIYIFWKCDILKKLAIKLSVFGIIIFITVPLSVQISNLIENSYQDTLNNAKTTEIVAEEQEKDNDDSLLSKFKEGISNIGDNVSELVKKGEQALSNFIDAIAILLITSCFIPIIVLIFLIWIIKMIFGINISLPNKKVIEKNHEE